MKTSTRRPARRDMRKNEQQFPSFSCHSRAWLPREESRILSSAFLSLQLLLLAGLFFLLLGATRSVSAAAKVSVDAVAEGLTCQCGCGLTVANCNHPQCEFSVPVRAQIEQMIDHGMTREQIIATFRAKYGEKILSAPTTEGFNLLAWLMPFAMIAAGCGLLLIVAGRWHAASTARDPGGSNGGPDDNGGFDPHLHKRLEADVKENA